MDIQKMIEFARAVRDASTEGAHGADEMLRELEAAQVRENERDAKYLALQAIGESAGQAIREMVAALNCDYDRLEELRAEKESLAPGELPADDAEELAELEQAAGECSDHDEAEQRIQEDALSVDVRHDWHEPSADREAPTEFLLLLATGGPAARIVGELNEHCEPCRARLETQDWFTAWTEYRGDAVSQGELLDYARCFYYGEG